MQAGKLRHRVTIEQVTSTRDSMGVPEETWSTLATVWAEVAAVSGREFVEGFRTQAEVTHSIWIRYRSDVTARMRCAEGSTHYDIVAVLDPDGRKEKLRLMCREIT